MAMRAKTTLNLGFKWECLEAVGLPAARRTCTPGFRCIPVVVIKGQGVCFARRRTRQRRHGNYSAGTRATEEPKKKALAEAIQVRAFEIGTHAPLGEYVNPLASRKNVTGWVIGPGDFYWNVKKNGD